MILGTAGLKQGAHISKQMALALKSRVGLSRSQCRHLQRLLKVIGITQENDHAQRLDKESLLGDHLEAQHAHFKFRNEHDHRMLWGSLFNQHHMFMYNSI